MQPGYILGKKWTIKSVIGEGGCAKVYAVESANQNQKISFPLVAKCIPFDFSGLGLSKEEKKEKERISLTLNRERQLLAPGQILSKFQYRPKIPSGEFYGKDEVSGVFYLIMERLDQDLEQWAVKSSPSSSSIANVGLQLLSGFEFLHQKGFLFIDVKPQNFMLRGNEVVFIDYGLMERFLSHNGAGFREQESKPFNGTRDFVSLDVHSGSVATPKDDLESMCYVLLALAHGGGALPWTATHSNQECLKMKREFDLTAYASSCECQEIAEIVQLLRKLSYGQRPDYKKIQELLEKMEKLDRKSNNKSNKITKTTATVSTVPIVKSSPNKTIKKKTSATMIEEKLEEICTTTMITKKKRKSDEIVNIKDDEEVVDDKVNKRSSFQPNLKRNKGTATSQNERMSTGPFSKSPNDMKSPLYFQNIQLTTGMKSGGRAGSFSPLEISLSGMSVTHDANGGRRSSLRSYTSCQSILSNVSSPLLNRNTTEEINALKLKIIDGVHKGEEYTINSFDLIPTNISSSSATKRGTRVMKKDPYQQRLIGRNIDADISLHRDDTVSDMHAYLLWKKTDQDTLELNIKDKGSTNGTVVNGLKLKSKSGWKVLQKGDIVELGESKFQVV